MAFRDRFWHLWHPLPPPGGGAVGGGRARGAPRSARSSACPGARALGLFNAEAPPETLSIEVLLQYRQAETAWAAWAAWAGKALEDMLDALAKPVAPPLCFKQ